MTWATGKACIRPHVHSCTRQYNVNCGRIYKPRRRSTQLPIVRNSCTWAYSTCVGTHWMHTSLIQGFTLVCMSMQVRCIRLPNHYCGTAVCRSCLLGSTICRFTYIASWSPLHKALTFLLYRFGFFKHTLAAELLYKIGCTIGGHAFSFKMK